MTSNYDKKSDISDNKLLKGLSNKELFELSAIGKKKDYNPGEVLFKEGGQDQMLFLILHRNSYPENVRNFLMESKIKMVEAKPTSVNNIDIGKII